MGAPVIAGMILAPTATAIMGMTVSATARLELALQGQSPPESTCPVARRIIAPGRMATATLAAITGARTGAVISGRPASGGAKTAGLTTGGAGTAARRAAAGVLTRLIAQLRARGQNVRWPIAQPVILLVTPLVTPLLTSLAEKPTGPALDSAGVSS